MRKGHFVHNSPIYYFLTIAVLIVALFPIMWMVFTSIKPELDSFRIPPVWLFKPTFANYVDAFHLRPLMDYIVNSIIIATTATIISVLLGVFAAYGFTRLTIGGSRQLQFWILSLRMLPPIAVALPLYSLWSNMGLMDTRLGLILVYVAMNLPLTVWVLVSFFRQLPKELDEAAMIDGCSAMGALWRVILPLALPGLTAVFVLAFIFCWNEFAFALILTNIHAKTIPVGIAAFSGESRGTDWAKICAVANTITMPVIVLAIIAQKYLVRGLSFGFIKE